MAIQVIGDILLLAGVAVVLICVAGLILVRSSYDRLHLLGPAGLVGAPLLAAAVVLRHGDASDGVKAILIALLLVISGPLIAHALGRSFRLQRGRALGSAKLVARPGNAPGPDPL